MVRPTGIAKAHDSGENFAYAEPTSSQKINSKLAYQLNQRKGKRATVENSPKRDLSDIHVY